MAIRGPTPKPAGQAIHRNPVHGWTEVPDAPFGGGSVLPKRRRSSGPWPEGVAEKWDAWSSMPHAKLWQASDWQFAMDTIEIAATWIDGGTVGLATELRNRETPEPS